MRPRRPRAAAERLTRAQRDPCQGSVSCARPRSAPVLPLCPFTCRVCFHGKSRRRRWRHASRSRLARRGELRAVGPRLLLRPGLSERRDVLPPHRGLLPSRGRGRPVPAPTTGRGPSPDLLIHRPVRCGRALLRRQPLPLSRAGPLPATQQLRHLQWLMWGLRMRWPGVPEPPGGLPRGGKDDRLWVGGLRDRPLVGRGRYRSREDPLRERHAVPRRPAVLPGDGHLYRSVLSRVLPGTAARDVVPLRHERPVPVRGVLRR